jgi:Beta-lactamase enzyme family
LRTPARLRSAAVAALAYGLVATILVAGSTVMSRTAPASHATFTGLRRADPGKAAMVHTPGRYGQGSRALPPVPAARQAPPACAPRAALAAALAPVLRHHTGQLAVAVTDTGTGVTAAYHAWKSFHTASIVKADILATLLLQLQRQRAGMDAEDQDLATDMIEDSDNAAASALWDVIGGAGGIAATDRTLGLHHTVPGQDGYWGLTSTTVTDQFHLLAALTSPRSPLSAASRHYELALMRDVTAGQNWGVTAAASRRSRPAVKNGWLPDGPAGLWVINSIGVIRRHGQRLLLAVLSSGQPSQQAGISQVQAAAKAAAAAITGIPPCP